MKRYAVLIVFLFATPAWSQNLIYAEDMIKNAKQGVGLYTLTQSSAPFQVLYADPYLQSPEDCTLGQSVAIQVLVINPSLPTDFFIWNDHAFYIRNATLDTYFQKGELVQKLSLTTPEKDIDVIWTDIKDNGFRDFVAIDISKIKMELVSMKDQLDDHRNFIENIVDVPVDVLHSIEALETTIVKLQTLHDELVGLRILFDTVDHHYDRNDAIHFINTLFEKSKTVRSPSYPFQFQLLVNQGEGENLCEVGSVYWQLAMSETIKPYGDYSSLLDIATRD